jgi:hypothetical protein
MSFSGIDLEVRLAGALSVGIDGFTPDAENYPQLIPPDDANTPGYYFFWDAMMRYNLYGEVPPYHKVICGIGVPTWQGNVSALQASATAKGFTCTGSTFEQIGNSILAQADSNWSWTP